MSTWGTKILAAVCRFCPVCVMRRRFPESGYAKAVSRIERTCPFCRAYDALHERPKDNVS